MEIWEFVIKIQHGLFITGNYTAEFKSISWMMGQ